MQIREPSEADLDALIAFFERVPESERTFFKEPVLDRATVEGWLTGERGRRGLALSDDGRVVGYVAVVCLTGWSDHVGEVRLVVDPAARGQGLGRTLVAALVDDARERGVETLTLDVRGNNHAAMVLYESFGFQVVGRLPDFVAVGAERWDRVLYRLDLRSADAPVRRHGARPVGPGASSWRPPSRQPTFPGPPLSGPAAPA